MSKREESAAERIWKEKLEPGISPGEAIAVLILVIAAGAFILVTST